MGQNIVEHELAVSIAYNGLQLNNAICYFIIQVVLEVQKENTTIRQK